MKPFHKVSKRIAKKIWKQHGKYYSENDLKYFYVGGLVNDCDGFNHRITKVEPDYIYTRNGRGRILVDISVYYQKDGAEYMLCTCPSSKKPLTQEEIHASILEWGLPEDWQPNGGWDFSSVAQDLQRLKDGFDVVDGDGIYIS